MTFQSGTLTPDATYGPFETLMASVVTPMMTANGWSSAYTTTGAPIQNPYTGVQEASYLRTFSKPDNGAPVYLSFYYGRAPSSLRLCVIAHEYLDTTSYSTAIDKATFYYTSYYGGGAYFDANGYFQAVYSPTGPGPTSIDSFAGNNPGFYLGSAITDTFEYWASVTHDRVALAIRFNGTAICVVGGSHGVYDPADATTHNIGTLGLGNGGWAASTTQKPRITTAGQYPIGLQLPTNGIPGVTQDASGAFLLYDCPLMDNPTPGVVPTVRGYLKGIKVTGQNNVLQAGDTITVGSATYCAMGLLGGSLVALVDTAA